MNRHLLWLAAATALALAAVPAASASAGASVSASVSGQPATRIDTGTRATTPTGLRLPGTHLPHLSLGHTVFSPNWSGYAAVAKRNVALRFVGANFTVPNVDCARSQIGSEGFAYASNWVGLDGYSDQTVEQTGVDSLCTSKTDPPQFDAWYEMYPNNPVVFTSKVSPGDALQASVYFNGSTYRMELADLTTGVTMQATKACPSGVTCNNSSAEVITEDPGDAEPGIDLAAFGQENFTGVGVTSRDGTKGSLNSNSLWTSSKIIMRDAASQEMAVPSALYGGRAYNDTWLRSS